MNPPQVVPASDEVDGMPAPMLRIPRLPATGNDGRNVQDQGPDHDGEVASGTACWEHRPMRHVRLGRTGLTVSKLCLGTMTFGYQCDEPTSIAILDKAFDAGITFIDTADVYPLGGDGTTVGRTEEIIGRWLPGHRDDVVLATKCVGPMSTRRWDRGASRKHIMDAIDGSLRRLGTDYIDLYQMHQFDPTVTHDETLSALTDLVRSGKVRYIGCSNYLAWELARAIGRSETLGLVRYDCVQPRYNLLYRNIERELLPLCGDEGVGVIPYNPIAGGFLSGKHLRGTPTEGSRFTLGSAAGRYQERYWEANQFDVVDALRPIAAECGVSLATMAMQWVLANPVVTSPIVGASRPAQLDDAIAAAASALDPAVKASLDELTLDFVNHPMPR
jgi:aryl-alcohol dehydrogenase (NADP+)